MSRIDIGEGHSIEFLEYKDDKRAGLSDYHVKPDGSPCGGFVSFRGGAWSKEFEGNPDHQSWEVASWEPLTISPSLLCRVCGDHGFIRDGKWVKA